MDLGAGVGVGVSVGVGVIIVAGIGVDGHEGVQRRGMEITTLTATIFMYLDNEG